jgi:hypothetical protein
MVTCFVVAQLLTGKNGSHQKESIQKKSPHARIYFAGMIRLRHDNHTHLANQFSQNSQVVRVWQSRIISGLPLGTSIR